MSRSKRKSNGDAFMMETKVKIIERVEQQEEEEVTEEQKRFTMQEVARGFSLFEEALLVLEA